MFQIIVKCSKFLQNFQKNYYNLNVGNIKIVLIKMLMQKEYACEAMDEKLVMSIAGVRRKLPKTKTGGYTNDFY